MSLITDYAISLSHLYGFVHREKVVEIYNVQNDDQITMSDIDSVMENEQEILKKGYIYVEEDYFVHETVLVFEEFDLLMKKKAGKPYYIPGKSELLKYKDEFYFEKTKEYRMILEYITREFVAGDKEQAQEISEDIAMNCQIESSPSEILNSISRFVEFTSEEQVGELMNLVVSLSNNTRIWSNNGFTPNELSGTDEKQHLRPLREDNVIPFSRKGTKKIGRNDPCPCGSGKKYKKCCL